MRTLLLLLSLLVFILPGCRKRSAPAAPVNTQPAAPPDPQKDTAEPPTAVRASSAAPSDPQKDTAELTMAVRAYYLSQGKHPATLDDLVQARCIYRLPTPPPGKKYAIDAKKLEAVLVNK